MTTIPEHLKALAGQLRAAGHTDDAQRLEWCAGWLADDLRVGAMLRALEEIGELATEAAGILARHDLGRPPALTKAGAHVTTSAIEAVSLDDEMTATGGMWDFGSGHVLHVWQQGPPPLTDAEWERNLVASYRRRGLPADVVTVFWAGPPNRDALDQTPGLYGTLNVPGLQIIPTSVADLAADLANQYGDPVDDVLGEVVIYANQLGVEGSPAVPDTMLSPLDAHHIRQAYAAGLVIEQEARK